MVPDVPTSSQIVPPSMFESGDEDESSSDGEIILHTTKPVIKEQPIHVDLLVLQQEFTQTFTIYQRVLFLI